MTLIMTRHLTAATELERQMAATHVGMPHWAGSGPAGATCDDCVFFKRADLGRSRLDGKCQKRLPGIKKPTTVDPYPASTAACRYLERRMTNGT
jgi:hypothetical protein